MVSDNPIKVVFFDARDTLGEVDRPGHLVPYKPSTERMLQDVTQMGVELAVITNLPEELTDDQGKDMVVNAVLSADPSTGAPVTIGKYIKRRNVITNKAAKANKPSRAIYEYAAKQLGARLEECMFIGENMGEV